MKGSYQFESLEERHQEAQFLTERAQLRLDGFIDLLKRHGFPRQGRVLEVGCAQGIRTRLMADNFKEAEVIGIDRSPELLSIARANKSNEKRPEYLEADLYELPFPDQSFDFIYSRLVFMHLENPIKALRSLLRVLKPGGRILIEDADRDCMFFEPEPNTFKSFWNKVQEGQRRLGGDPNVGRKLAPYMKDLGLKDIQIETQPIIGGGSDIAFLVETLLPSLNTYLDPSDRKSGLSAIGDLKSLSLLPTATFYHFWFVVSGEKS